MTSIAVQHNLNTGSSMSIIPTTFKDSSTLIAATHEAVDVVDKLLAKARAFVRQQVNPDGGRFDNAVLNENQHCLHGLSWLATYTEALRQLAEYAQRLHGESRFGELEQLLVQVAFGEYLNQIAGGIPMSQTEFVRTHELGLEANDLSPLHQGNVGSLFRNGNSPSARAGILKLMCEQIGRASCRERV